MLILLMNAYNDDEEFARIFDEYYGYALKICYNKVKDYFIAEDILITAFYKVYLFLDRNRSKESIKSFIATVVTNETINYLKSKSNNYSAEFELNDEYDYNLREWDNFPLDKLASDETINEIFHEIINMPPKISGTMMLAYKHEYSPKEISEILNIPEKTVYSRLRNGKKYLKDRLLHKEDDKNKKSGGVL